MSLSVCWPCWEIYPSNTTFGERGLMVWGAWCSDKTVGLRSERPGFKPRSYSFVCRKGMQRIILAGIDQPAFVLQMFSMTETALQSQSAISINCKSLGCRSISINKKQSLAFLWFYDVYIVYLHAETKDVQYIQYPFTLGALMSREHSLAGIDRRSMYCLQIKNIRKTYNINA